MNVPPQPRLFVGRDALLDDLKARLMQSDVQVEPEHPPPSVLCAACPVWVRQRWRRR